MSGQMNDQTITIDTVFGTLHVIVTREALHVLRNERGGPQDGPGLIAAHHDMIAQVATMKFEADEGEDNQTVRVTDRDLDD